MYGITTREYTDADYKRMGYFSKEDYERQERRKQPRYKGERPANPGQKEMMPDDYTEKGMDYADKGSY